MKKDTNTLSEYDMLPETGFMGDDTRRLNKKEIETLLDAEYIKININGKIRWTGRLVMAYEEFRNLCNLEKIYYIDEKLYIDDPKRIYPNHLIEDEELL